MICWGSRKKAGFTLMELMVYIALLGGIVLIAGQAFSDSTRMRVRTQSMLQGNQIAGNLSILLKEDIAQMGAKSTKESNADRDSFYINSLVFMDTSQAVNDLSSYSITKNDGGTDLDKLTMRRLRYDDDGHYEAVEEVSWFVDNGTLKRSCTIIDSVAGKSRDECPPGEPTVVTIAEGINKFEVIAAEPGAKSDSSRIFPSVDTNETAFRLVPRYGADNLAYFTIDPDTGGSVVTLSGFASNYNFSIQEPNLSGKNSNQAFLADSNNLTGNWAELCHKITLDSNAEYELSFFMPFTNDGSRLFCPGRDYMAVGFRTANIDALTPIGLNDYVFYPPTNSGASERKRKFRFRSGKTIQNVCVAFTFASYSPIVSTGKIKFSKMELKKVESANYKFTGNNIDTKEKKNVKAMKLNISVGVNNENSILSLIIPVPSNGITD